VAAKAEAGSHVRRVLSPFNTHWRAATSGPVRVGRCEWASESQPVAARRSGLKRRVLQNHRSGWADVAKCHTRNGAGLVRAR